MTDLAPSPHLIHLFEPLQIGPVTVRNRIVSSGHDTVMAVDGKVTGQLVAYQEARSQGGAGLIVTQVAGVHQSAKYTSHVLMADDDSCIPGLTALATAVKSGGATAFQQLFHDGREMMESEDGTMAVALAPSAVPSERFMVMPRAMPNALVHEMIGCYASAAARVRTAGFDGVEVVASHGYLPAQFLNPRTNLRTDEFGGSLENRLRFLHDVLVAVRAAVGSQMAVGIRISVGERSDEGLTEGETLEALALLDGDHLLDYVSVTVGTSATLSGSGHIVPPMTTATGYTTSVAARTKAVVSVPVIAAGRVNQPQDADRIIAQGEADAVIMTRALICDPEMPTKAKAGELDEIRACIGCNQACIGHFHAGYPISCIQHPETGRERTYGVRIRTTTPQHVVVVGGGPAGMKAAAVAGERGHRVTLLEADRRLGGQIWLAQEVPGRAEFGGAIDNLRREVERASVAVHLNTRADAALLAELRPDAIVLATGAVARIPEMELMGDLTLLTAWDVLRGVELPAGRIAVADWRCDWIGLGVATLLAQQGHPVTLGSSGYYAGQRLQQYVRDAMIGEATKLGVEMVPLVRPYGADDDTVWFQHVLTGEPVTVSPVSALVLSQGHVAVDDLFDAAHALGVPVHVIGDCLAPRTVEEAVLEGLKVGSLL